MTLHHIILHKIEKIQHATQAKISKRDSELPIEDPIIVSFVQSVVESYFKRSSRQYSKFESADENEPAFKTYLDMYLSSSDFMHFSKKSADLLKEKMCDQPASTGGYFVIADIEIDHRFIMVILLNKKGSSTIDDDSLSIGHTTVLDIDQFAMAGFLNISLYQDQQDDRRYMSFMRGERDVSRYFARFLGSAQETLESASTVTNRFVHTVQNYMNERGYEQERIDHISLEILRYGDAQKKDRQPINLHTIANIINSEDPESFFHYAQDNEISAFIESIDMRTLKKLQDFRYKGKGYSVTFNKNLISNEMVQFDGHILTIKVDDKFKEAWQEEGLGNL